LKNSEKQKNKFTPEVLNKLKEERLSRSQSEQYIINLKKSCQEARYKHSQTCFYCGKESDKGNYTKLHGINCKKYQDYSI
jgi:hypothetical protein